MSKGSTGQSRNKHIDQCISLLSSHCQAITRFAKAERESFSDVDLDVVVGVRQTLLDRKLSGHWELVAETSSHYRWHLCIHGRIEITYLQL